MMLHGLAQSLLRYELIRTVLPKAKELRLVVEPMITLAKRDTVANRRRIFARMPNDEIVDKLFRVIAVRFAHRPGGYTRVLRCGFRTGDNAPLACVELLDARR